MKNQLKRPRSLAFLGLMLAITIIMSFTPIGFIPLFGVSATIVHIPTIITGITLGPVGGLIMGTAFGVVSLINAITRPAGILDPLFMNPLVSVLPRMFIGVAAYYIFLLVSKLFKKESLKNSVSSFVGGIAGSLTNTVLVFMMLFIFYAGKVEEAFGDSFGTIFAAVFTTNGILEAVVSGFITMPIAMAYFRVSKMIKK